jgi:hypothetical protein
LTDSDGLVTLSASELVPTFTNSVPGGKIMRNVFHFIAEWLLPKIFVDISHQVDETLLLRTIKVVISGVEVRYQNASEIPKHLLGGFNFPSITVYERHVLQVSEHPHISVDAFDHDFGFIGMD